MHFIIIVICNYINEKWAVLYLGLEDIYIYIGITGCPDGLAMI